MDSEGDGNERRATQRLVVRNTLFLAGSQALTIPLSVVMNAVMARYLGAGAFGIAYLASTLSGLGFLAVGWGHEGVLPAAAARDPTVAGRMLGSSLAWRAVLSVVVYAVLALVSHGLRYSRELQWALALTCVQAALTAFIGACKDTIRGLERADIPAYAHVGQQLLAAVIIVPVLMLGGDLNATLVGQIVTGMLVLLAVWRTLPGVGVGAPSVSREALASLFRGGTPFVAFGIAMALQPNIDAVFLSKLAPEEVMGWYAVARRLVGVILFPASALIGALYPTLCRLHIVDTKGFASTTSGSLRAVSLLVFPAALGCALFPDLAIAIFSRKSFGPAEDNLRVLSAFVFLVYFSMPLGTCILAAGKQRIWSLVQSLCVAVSLALDPLLVPLFQRRFHNGGLGLCLATVVSEVVVVACGLFLVPRGVLDRNLLRTVALALFSGCVMAIVARLAAPLTSWVAAPLALLAYGLALWLTRAIEEEQMAGIRSFIQRRFSRSRDSTERA
jgi:O-antigen/teichoic acid export membrane protein